MFATECGFQVDRWRPPGPRLPPPTKSGNEKKGKRGSEWLRVNPIGEKEDVQGLGGSDGLFFAIVVVCSL